MQFNEVKFINLSPKGSSFSMVLDPTLNGENMRFWLTFFIGLVFAHFLSIWHEEDIIQQLKAWSFQMWKNLVHMQSNSGTIGRWSVYWYRSNSSKWIQSIKYWYLTNIKHFPCWYTVISTRVEIGKTRNCHTISRFPNFHVRLLIDITVY